MDLKAKIGQKLIVGFAGPQLDEEFVGLVREYKVGNVILFRRNIQDAAQLRRLCADLKALIGAETGVPPFITIDQEGGIVARLTPEMLSLPGAMALAAAGGEQEVYRAARITARQLRSLGVNFNLAPVLDVNSNPANPVIGVRSFGDDPAQVARLAMACARGTMQEGVMVCGKHFPGHGDTAVDSHLGLPAVEKSRAQLDACELLPFRRAVEAGLPALMSSHILFPALEPDRLPATMSRRILTGLLREELGFTGLLLSDCMEMGAIQTYYGTVRGVAATVAAGVDMAFISHTAAFVREGAQLLRRQYEDGTLPLAELDASVGRILAAKGRFAALPPCEECGASLQAEAAGLLERSFTLVRGPLPPLGDAPFFVGCAKYRATQASTGEEPLRFAQAMAEQLGGRALTTAEDPAAGEIAEVLEQARGASCVVLGTCNAALRPGQQALMRALGGLGLPLAVAALQSPYDLLSLPRGAAGIAVWEYTAQSLRALPPFLSGRRALEGRLPLLYFAAGRQPPCENAQI